MKNKKINDMLNLIDDEFISEADPNLPKKTSFAKRYIWKNIAACLVVVLLATNIATLIPLFNRSEPNENMENGDLMPPMEDGNGDEGSNENTGNNETDPELPPSTLPEITPDDENAESGESGELDESISSSVLTPLPSEYDKVVEKLEGKGDGNVKDSVIEDQLKEEVQDSMEDLEDVLNKNESALDKYVEVTDNQVSGVIEGDLFKRTESHIFYIQGASLVIYEIKGASSSMVGKISLIEELTRIGNKLSRNLDNKNEELIGSEEQSYLEMVLSQDSKTVTVITKAYELDYFEGVAITTISVENPREPYIKSTRAVLGKYIATRLVNNSLIVITDYKAFKDSKGLKYGYVPMVYTNGDFKHVPSDRIYMPNSISTSNYTVITMLDQENGRVKDIYAYLDLGSSVYVSNNRIYLSKFQTVADKGLGIEKSESTLTLIEYDMYGFTHKGTLSFDGEIKNQYSIDEYNGILRVVTTLREEKFNIDYETGEIIDRIENIGDERTNAALFCYDLSTMEKICEIRNFAPDGEEVQSVRFDKNYAYVCTAVVKKMTDPVFFIDLSDLNNPKVSETGEIEGYSSSLVSLGDGYLLGIGYGANTSTLKVEVYKEENGEVISVATYEKSGTGFSEDYKAYFIDREKGLIGLGVTQSNVQKYIVLKFVKSAEDIGLALSVNVNGSYNLKRATLINGEFYILAPSGLYVRELVTE